MNKKYRDVKIRLVDGTELEINEMWGIIELINGGVKLSFTVNTHKVFYKDVNFIPNSQIKSFGCKVWHGGKVIGNKED